MRSCLCDEERDAALSTRQCRVSTFPCQHGHPNAVSDATGHEAMPHDEMQMDFLSGKVSLAV